MKKINKAQLKQLVEAAIFVADKPIGRQQLKDTVLSEFAIADRTLSAVINELKLDYQPRGIQLVEVASGYRFQSLDALSPWLSRMWQESAPRYSRAMLETLALIAYRQPITRGEIEQVRGVAVSSNIIKTLSERDWIKVVGHKEVAGRPALYATTRAFLDYFSLSSLEALPSADAFAQMMENEDSDAPLKVVKEAPSNKVDRATHNEQNESEELNE